MVTFKNWLINILSDRYAFLKINKNGVLYSIPYGKTDGRCGYDKSNDCLILENLLTKSLDAISLPSVLNIVAFHLNDSPKIGNEVILKNVESKLRPMLDVVDKNVFAKDIQIIFINDNTSNYIKLMEFMEYTQPEDFKKVRFCRDTKHELSKKWFADIVRKKHSIVEKELFESLKDKNSKIFSDLSLNVENFINNLDESKIETWEDKWPSLLNPSPYTDLPKKIQHDG